MLKIKTRYFQNDVKVGSWLSMEIKILPVIFILFFSEKNNQNKIKKFVGSASFHEITPFGRFGLIFQHN